MKVGFQKPALAKLAFGTANSRRWSAALVRTYRLRIHIIKQARDRRDLYALSSLHLEKLKGERRHQYSVKLDSQFRIILEFEKSDGTEMVNVIDIEDYHK